MRRREYDVRLEGLVWLIRRLRQRRRLGQLLVLLLVVCFQRQSGLVRCRGIVHRFILLLRVGAIRYGHVLVDGVEVAALRVRILQVRMAAGVRRLQAEHFSLARVLVQEENR